MKNIIDLIGRSLVAVIFIYDGLDSVFYFQKTKELMTSYGLNWQQDVLLLISIVLLLVGGTLVLIGYRASFGSILLLLYWIPVTFIVHSFWNETGEGLRLELNHFMKNLAIAGGLFIILVNGSGRYSVKTLLANTRVPKRLR